MAKIKNYQEYLSEMAEIRVICAKCGRKDARLTPMGVICLTCSFEKGEKMRAKNPKRCDLSKLCKYHPCARQRCIWYRKKIVDFSEIEKYITSKTHLLS